MAESGGHWSTLAEAQKLTESTKIPGVFETDVKRNNPMDRIPVVQAAGSGKSIKFLREKTTTEDSIQALDIGEEIVVSEDMEYDEIEVELKRLGVARMLDKFVRDVYGTFNNYRAQVLLELEKGLRRKTGDMMIYGDKTFNSAKQFDGLHALVAETITGKSADLNIDNATAGLSLANLRKLIDAMPYGVDEIWAPYAIIKWLDAAYEEKGFAGLATATAGNLGFISRGLNEVGKRVLFWDGIPIVRTDYLVAEQEDTGLTDATTARAKYSSGTKNYSLFAIKFGNIYAKEPGVCLGFGGTTGIGDFYKLDTFDKILGKDAEAMQCISYLAMLQGSYLTLGRIVDITDAAVTV